MSNHGIHLLIGPEAHEVFNRFADRRDPHDEDQRDHRNARLDWKAWNIEQEGDGQEVKVCNAQELVEQIDWQEGQECVFRGLDLIANELTLSRIAVLENRKRTLSVRHLARFCESTKAVRTAEELSNDISSR
jgi:hypothetical protein